MMKEFGKRYRAMASNSRPWQLWWLPRKPRTAGQDLADFFVNLHPASDKTVFDVPGSRTYKAWLGIISLWKCPWWARTKAFHESTVPKNHTTISLKPSFVLPHSSKVRFLCGDQENSWPEIGDTTMVAKIMLYTPGIDSKFLVGAQKWVNKLVNLRSQRIQLLLVSFLAIL